LFTVFTSAIKVSGQDAFQTVIAKKGDGIISLLRKQGFDPYESLTDFVALNIDDLRDSVHLYEGRKYKMPAKKNKVPNTSKSNVLGKSKEYPIFGKKHASVAYKSEKLNGTVYYLVSGHGGPDPGALAKYKGKLIAEDEYAYDITLRLAKELLSHGAKVYIIVRDANDGIRDERVLSVDHDEVVFPNKVIPLNQLKRLNQRVETVNSLYVDNKGKYQRLIVTHIDSRSVGQNIDVFFYHHEKSKNGKQLAENIHKTFQKKYKKYQPNRDYKGTFEDRSGLYMVKNTIPAMAYIEIGNIRNKKDQKRILDSENRQALAKWISEGVLLDYETRR